MRRQQDDVPRWWDADLAHGRRAARHAARRDPKSPAARALRQQYQQLLRRTQRRWTHSQAIALTELTRSTNSKKFWQKFKPAKVLFSIAICNFLAAIHPRSGAAPSQMM